MTTHELQQMFIDRCHKVGACVDEFRALKQAIDNPIHFGRVFHGADNNLLLPASGRRDWGDGVQYNQGSQGYYWSSSVYDSNYGYYCYFNSGGGVNPESGCWRGSGYSVRCVQELAA